MDKIKELLFRGVEDIIVRTNLEKKLKAGAKLRVYYGIDPTSPQLHLGHSVVLWKLRQFQELGHEIILLIGDFTARIGDPTDRNAIRKPLTESEINKNMQGYQKQAGKILDINKVKIKYNSQWLSGLNFGDIIKIASCFTVQQMLDRDMFQKRIKEDKPIGLHEFLYPLMQGYDSAAMNVDLEIGGSDQLFNMLAGRRLQKIYNKKEKNVLTIKLLPGLDGKKMSKTFDNFIALDIEPNNMFGKIMSMHDEIMPDYFELATRLPQEEIKKILRQKPRDAKARLAFEIVKLYHCEKSAKKAEKEFKKIFKEKKAPSKMPEIKLSVVSYQLSGLLVKTKLASSKSEAKRLIKQGAVKIDNQVLKDPNQKIKIKNNLIIQKGKLGFAKIKVG
ncbi:MAG: tyrosine--tRNA ligase [bacterium]